MWFLCHNYIFFCQCRLMIITHNLGFLSHNWFCHNFDCRFLLFIIMTFMINLVFHYYNCLSHNLSFLHHNWLICPFNLVCFNLSILIRIVLKMCIFYGCQILIDYKSIMTVTGPHTYGLMFEDLRVKVRQHLVQRDAFRN